MTEPTALAEQRIRTLLAELGPDTYNLGGEIVDSPAFRSEEWPRGFYALNRPDMEALLALLDQAREEVTRVRSLRLDRPSQAVDPAVHTPAQVLAYLRELGWEREGGADIAELWRDPVSGQRVTVSLHPDAPDYARRMGELASDLATLHGMGELQILAEIAEGSGA